MSMSYTRAATATYTVVDVRRVLASFAADYAMIAQATGAHSAATVDRINGDLTILAEEGYLRAVDIVLLDASGVTRRAAKYTISTTASGWTTSEPGNNLWPRLPGASLTVIATLSDAWWELSPAQRQQFRERTGLQGSWEPTDVDTTFIGMSRTLDRRYASNGYGMEKVLYAS